MWYKKHFRCILKFVVIIVIFTMSVVGMRAQHCDSLVGHWMNQDSSIMMVDSDHAGKLLGHYQSNASNDADLFPLDGFVNRALVIPTLSFAVSWGTYGSITSWTGYCKTDEKGPYIKTMWHLVRPYAEEDWERFVTNTSTFRPRS